jgi:hypothetical protein
LAGAAVVRHALGVRPMRRAFKSFKCGVSHSLALLRRVMVRAGFALPTRIWPAFSTRNGGLLEGFTQ